MTSEPAQAKQWRLAHGWTLDQLAELTGYSRPAIYCFERGTTPKGTPIDPYAWFRYKRICAAVELDLNGTFSWGG